MESFWGFSNSVRGDKKKDGKKRAQKTLYCVILPLGQCQLLKYLFAVCICNRKEKKKTLHKSRQRVSSKKNLLCVFKKSEIK